MFPVPENSPSADAGQRRHTWRVDPGDILTPDELARVRARSDLKGLWAAGSCWALIGGAMALYGLWPSVVTALIAILIVGARQLGLAVLMHDAAHGILTRSAWLNDHLGQWWCAVPVGADLLAYRRYHLKHHRFVQQPNDPDLVLSAPFPVTKGSLRRKIVRDLTGQTFLKQRSAQLRGVLGGAKEPLQHRLARTLGRLGPFYGVHLAFLVAFSAFGRPDIYFVGWLIPMATWSMLVTRIRNIAEHAVVPDNDDPLRNARTTIAGPLTRLLLAPYAVNYHVEHHMFMWVPHYNLRHLHRMLMDKGLGEHMEIQPSYWTVLGMATRADT